MCFSAPEKGDFSQDSDVIQLAKIGPFSRCYDVSIDKGEKKDIKESHPEITEHLKSVYGRFWEDARKHMINEEPEETNEDKSEFHEMYLKEMGQERYKAALSRKDELHKYYFRSK